MGKNLLKSLSGGQGTLIIGIIIFALIIPLGTFVYNFSNQAISHKISDWGSMGDFVGGLIGTIINFVNLIFLVYITYKLSTIDSNREKENLKFQSLISLNELRNNTYKDINQVLKQFTTETTIGDSKSFTKCALYASEVGAFCEGMSHLFPILNDKVNYEGLLQSMQVLLENIQQRKGELSQEQKSKDRNDTNIYVEEKDEFLKKIQLDILSNNPLKLIQDE